MTVRPPRLAELLMRKLTWADDRESLLDNLAEEYADRAAERGPARAGWWYRLQAAKSALPLIGFEAHWRTTMLMNHLKTAFRHHRKQKTYFLINLAGLAIGMAACLFIMLWVQDEISYDSCHKRLNDISFVVQYSTDAPDRAGSSVPAPLIPELKATRPEIEHAARYLEARRRLFAVGDQTAYETEGAFADPELFDIFTFPSLANDPKAALKDLNTIVLTESLARRYFGAADAVGKTIKLENQYVFTVGAVLKDIPRNSTVRFDYVLPFENFGRFDRVELTNWGRYEGYTGFVTLKGNAQPGSFSARIRDTLQLHQEASSRPTYLRLHPLKNIRLLGFSHDGTLTSVLMFSVIAILVLLIACINFVNLTTAQAAKRAVEIGLRKVIGASRTVIRRQMYTELAVTVTSAFLVAIALVAVFLPKISALSGTTIAFSLAGKTGLILVILGIAVFTAAVSGLYPALYLSSLPPARVMKPSGSLGPSRSILRKILVIAQFTISVILIISTFVIGLQMRYIKTKELGFDKDHLMYVELPGNLKQRIDVLKQELLGNPDVRGVTAATSLPSSAFSNAGSLDWEGKPADVEGSLNFVSVDKDYFRTVGIEFVEGRTFQTTPSNARLPEFIVNEKAVETMKVGDPLGKSFTMWDRPAGRVIGVVKNVHNAPLYENIHPVFYVQFPYFYNYLILNVRSEHLPRTIGFIRDAFQKTSPEYPFEIHFLDEAIDRYYQQEAQRSGLITAFTALALFISCLGLFGLSLFLAEQRTKEIGIRKTLGATVSNLVGLMVRDFLWLVALANLIAWPVAYYLMKSWLQRFAFKIDLGIPIFLVSGLTVMAVALATVCIHAFKSATANPVRALRQE
jgi:putative ABC transport system permease protein